MPIAQIINASCSRRSLELAQVRRFLVGNGYSVSKDDWEVDLKADVIILSTCGFTEAAENAGFETLQRIQREKKTDAKVIFGGCIPKINPIRVAKEFNGSVFDPRSYYKLNIILNTEQSFEGFGQREIKTPPSITNSTKRLLINDIKGAMQLFKTFDGSFSGLEHLFERLHGGLRKRIVKNYANLDNRRTFYIQIQEGCSMRCSYCVIRKAIGDLKSKPIETILDEFKIGLSNGFKQFQLMGDNAGSYGLDIGSNMGDLINRISAIEENFSLDLTDINPVYLHSMFEAVKTLSKQNKLSRLYVPIQSANRRILKLMKRDCDINKVKQMLIEIKKNAPSQFKLGTSLIVGYPSETIEELNDTIKFCKEVEFDWIWCHSFSVRPDTPAALLSESHSAEEIFKRATLVKSQLKKRSFVTTAGDTLGNKTCQG